MPVIPRPSKTGEHQDLAIVCVKAITGCPICQALPHQPSPGHLRTRPHLRDTERDRHCMGTSWLRVGIPETPLNMEMVCGFLAPTLWGTHSQSREYLAKARGISWNPSHNTSDSATSWRHWAISACNWLYSWSRVGRGWGGGVNSSLNCKDMDVVLLPVCTLCC